MKYNLINCVSKNDSSDRRRRPRVNRLRNKRSTVIIDIQTKNLLRHSKKVPIACTEIAENNVDERTVFRLRKKIVETLFRLILSCSNRAWNVQLW